MNKQRRKSVAVIGAGACGICAAKTLREAGFVVTVYEIGSRVGGMWVYDNDNGLSSAYRTLHINTSRSVTRFSDFDFARDVQPFPDHADMRDYLYQYAQRFQLLELIRFNTPVSAVTPEFQPGSEPPRWRVDDERGASSVYDGVIVASGHLHVPRHVAMLRDHFAGQYLHSHDYREPQPFVGKRICIVGVGNSACDISGDLCATAARCVLVARSGVLVLPKLMFGRPFTDISSKLQKPWVPYALRRRVIQTLTWLAHGDMQKLGFKKPGARVHTTSNGTIVTDIAYRRIEVKQGIERIAGDVIHFVDGSREAFDVLIGATGYRTELPFLSDQIVAVGDNELELYQRIVPPDWPGLYLLGFFNTDTALNFIFEHQARWVCEIELGTAKLPSAQAMRDAIAARSDWVRRHYRHTPRHNLEEESVPYISALRSSLKTMRRRAARAA